MTEQISETLADLLITSGGSPFLEVVARVDESPVELMKELDGAAEAGLVSSLGPKKLEDLKAIIGLLASQESFLQKSLNEQKLEVMGRITNDDALKHTMLRLSRKGLDLALRMPTPA